MDGRLVKETTKILDLARKKGSAGHQRGRGVNRACVRASTVADSRARKTIVRRVRVRARRAGEVRVLVGPTRRKKALSEDFDRSEEAAALSRSSFGLRYFQTDTHV